MERNSAAGTPAPFLSIVVPIFDEERSLPELVRRVAATARAAGWPSWELVCVLDGCTDRSREALEGAASDGGDSGRLPVRIVEFVRNRGQHVAVFAGLEHARGALIGIMDADLQNPPEELPRLVDVVQAGASGGVGQRRGRQDAGWRRVASRAFNATMAMVAGGDRDLGCMLRVYRREVVESFLQSREAPLFLPVQLGRRAPDAVFLSVGHAAREHGESRYDASRLARLFANVIRSRFHPPRLPDDRPLYEIAR